MKNNPEKQVNDKIKKDLHKVIARHDARKDIAQRCNFPLVPNFSSCGLALQFAEHLLVAEGDAMETMQDMRAILRKAKQLEQQNPDIDPVFTFLQNKAITIPITPKDVDDFVKTAKQTLTQQLAVFIA